MVSSYTYGFSLLHSTCPILRPIYACISVTVQLLSSVHFQKMFRNCNQQTCLFSLLKYEGRFVARCDSVSNLFISEQSHLYIRSCSVGFDILLYYLSFPLSTLSVSKVLNCTTSKQTFYVFFCKAGQPAIIFLLSHSTCWHILYGICNHL
jgi:hypothetical protein